MSQKQQQTIITTAILILLVFALPHSTLNAKDSVIIQTFTFDSIITRQATFKFPDKNEHFYKVIGKYRLKCDPQTQYDKYDCGEWDYHAYSRILTPPSKDKLFLDTQFPTTSFGSFLFPQGEITKELIALHPSSIYAMHKYMYHKPTSTASDEKSFSFEVAETTIQSVYNLQFVIAAEEL